MRARRRDRNKKAVSKKPSLSKKPGSIGIVLSGGGARAAYQIGALKALAPYLKKNESQIKVIVGSSIGAINSLLFAACLKDGVDNAISVCEEVWKERTFKNTFSDSPSMAFFRAIKLATMQYLNPGPNPDNDSIFDPTPLMQRLDGIIDQYGGLSPENRIPTLESLAVMTTVEGEQRKPLLFVSSHRKLEEEVMRGATFQNYYVDALKAKHGFASAALPSVLPPVEIDTNEGIIRLVDGGISQNVPVDPAVRLGAEKALVVDISGRDWWLDRFDESLDTRPEWEVPAEAKTFCLRPPDTFVVRCRQPLGPLFKNAISSSRTKFIKSVGPLWPIFAMLKNKVGEDVAYETLSYVALDPDYIQGLIERGYNETIHQLRNREEPEYEHNESYEELAEHMVK